MSHREASRRHDVYDKETSQRLHNLQQEREIHEAFLRDYERRCAENQMDANIAEGTLQASRQMLKSRLGLGTDASATTATSRFDNGATMMTQTADPRTSRLLASQ